MRKILPFALALAVMAGCANKGGEGSADSATDTVLTDTVSRDTLAVSDTLDPAADSLAQAQAEAFLEKIPDPRGLCYMELTAGTIDKYLPTLGYKVAGKNKWELKAGPRTCTVEQKDTYFEKDGKALVFEVTVTGDDEALNTYYERAKNLEDTEFGVNYSVEKVGNTVFTQEVGL